jgi:hypothetical protein
MLRRCPVESVSAFPQLQNSAVGVLVHWNGSQARVRLATSYSEALPEEIYIPPAKVLNFHSAHRDTRSLSGAEQTAPCKVQETVPELLFSARRAHGSRNNPTTLPRKSGPCRVSSTYIPGFECRVTLGFNQRNLRRHLHASSLCLSGVLFLHVLPQLFRDERGQGFPLIKGEETLGFCP